jgi:hypothetical protein
MAKNTTILALAGALTALAAAITEEYGSTETPAGPSAVETPAKVKAKPVKPAPAAEDYKTYDELKEIITPLVDAKRAPEVKAILKRLGVEALKDLPGEKQAEFLKDVEALLNDSV